MTDAMIATMVFDKGSYTESNVILNSLKALTELGIPINCVYEGRLHETEKGLKEIGVEISPQKEKGLGYAIHQTMKEAYDKGADIVVYTEPNKHQAFWPQIPKLIEPIKNNKADITFASRDAESIQTYPFNRKSAEKWFNLIAGSVTGIPGDFVFGTKGFARDVVPEFEEFWNAHKKNNWVELMGSTFQAMYKGKRAKMVEVSAPAIKEEQLELSRVDTNYRITQGVQNLESLIMGYGMTGALDELTKQYRELLEDEFTRVPVTYY